MKGGCRHPSGLLDGFPFDGWIMGCGTRILLRGKTLQAMEYDPDSSLKLLNLFRTLRMPAVYECDTAMYFDPEGAPSVFPGCGFRGCLLRPAYQRDFLVCFAEEKEIRGQVDPCR